MALSHTQVILTAAVVVVVMACLIVIVLFRVRRTGKGSGKPGFLARFRRPLPAGEPRNPASGEGPAAPDGEGEGRYSYTNYYGLGGEGTTSTETTDVGGPSTQPMAALYRRIGQRQKVAALGFVAASVVFLGLSVLLSSVVLEIDSVVSFAVAAILFLKEPRGRVQSKVLGAMVLSQGSTIAGLSSRAGSGFCYTPQGKGISDVSVVNSLDGVLNGQQAAPFSVMPPGMGMATLFARETEGSPMTLDSLKYLLPHIVKENFGLAGGVEIKTADNRVEIVLRNPAVHCNCQIDEPRSTAVVGCTVSSFLAVLYAFASQRALYLDRCSTDAETKMWRISMSFQPTST